MTVVIDKLIYEMFSLVFALLIVALLLVSGCEKDPHSEGPQPVAEDSKLVELVEKLSSSSTEERGNAVFALGKYGPQAQMAVPDLVPLLKDDDWAVRSGTADTLGKIGPAAGQAVSALVECLKDSHPDVSLYAARALGEIGLPARSAVPALLEAFEQDHDSLLRGIAGRSLVQLGRTTATVQALLQDLKDENRRKNSYKALAEIGPIALDGLVKMLKDPDWSARSCAVRALGRMGAEAKPALGALLIALNDPHSSVRANAAEALANTGPGLDALPHLKRAAADEDRFVRCGVAVAVARINPASSSPDAVSLLITLLRDKEFVVRRSSAIALGTMAHPGNAAVQALTEASRDKEQVVREAALEALRAIQEK